MGYYEEDYKMDSYIDYGRLARPVPDFGPDWNLNRPDTSFMTPDWSLNDPAVAAESAADSEGAPESETNPPPAGKNGGGDSKPPEEAGDR